MRLGVATSFVIALAGLARGHSFEPALLALEETRPGVFDVVWKSPALADAIVPRLPSGCRRLEGAMAGEGPSRFRVDCGARGLAGATIAVDGLDGGTTDVIVRVARRDGRVATGVLRNGADRFVVPGAASGRAWPAVLGGYLRLGVGHILGGADHLLFLVALLLLVDGWWRLVETVSAFTLAHSLTLAAAVLGVVTPPVAAVEAAIALSIVFVAAELVRPPEAPPTLTRRRPWLVAFAFGLLHGLGFARALVELGLPADGVPLALAGFNVGVELGQLAFLSAMIAPVALVRRLPSRVRPAPAWAIGSVAAAWTFARVATFWASPW